MQDLTRHRVTRHRAFIFLSRRLGYTAERWEEGATRLATNITRHMAWTQQFFANRFGAVTQG